MFCQIEYLHLLEFYTSLKLIFTYTGNITTFEKT